MVLWRSMNPKAFTTALLFLLRRRPPKDKPLPPKR